MTRWSEGELAIYEARRGVEIVRDEKGEPVRILLGARSEAKPGVATLIIPGLKLVSEANARVHWAVRAKRFKEQKWAVIAAWKDNPPRVPKGPLTVTITRIGPKSLDTDNLAGSAKGVRDAIASLLGVDDGSDQVSWRYAQEAIGRRQYATRIEITEMAQKGVA